MIPENISKLNNVLLNKKAINEYLSFQVSQFVKYVIETLLKLEIEYFLGRQPYRRHKKEDKIKIHRNGYRYRLLLTQWCKIEYLKIPRLRQRGYEFKLFQDGRTIDKELIKHIILLYVQGNSYRDLSKYLFKKYGLGLSIMTISRMMMELEGYLQQYRNKEIRQKYDNVYIDGMEISIKELRALQYQYLKKRHKNAVVLIVLGVRKEGKKVIKEVIGYKISTGEDELSYRELLLNLKQRGLKKDNIGIIIHDGAPSREFGNPECIWR